MCIPRAMALESLKILFEDRVRLIEHVVKDLRLHSKYPSHVFPRKPGLSTLARLPSWPWFWSIRNRRSADMSSVSSITPGTRFRVDYFSQIAGSRESRESIQSWVQKFMMMQPLEAPVPAQHRGAEHTSNNSQTFERLEKPKGINGLK